MQCLIMVSFIVIWQRGVDVYIVLSGLFYISATKKEKKIISMQVLNTLLLNTYTPMGATDALECFLMLFVFFFSSQEESMLWYQK